MCFCYLFAFMLVKMTHILTMIILYVLLIVALSVSCTSIYHNCPLCCKFFSMWGLTNSHWDLLEYYRVYAIDHMLLTLGMVVMVSMVHLSNYSTSFYLFAYLLVSYFLFCILFYLSCYYYNKQVSKSLIVLVGYKRIYCYCYSILI